ncbi:MAG: DUF1294 domain-containing protein [Coriobacteriia bacterium]|nr:DUF1294 domain-containing protein [Coriobacteriia bacterium]
MLASVGPALLAVLLVYVAMSAALFAIYGMDKSAARKGLRRVPEASLHLMALLGGWPGALLGQGVFHHKTRKQSFQTIFWCTVVANCAGLSWLLWQLSGSAR